MPFIYVCTVQLNFKHTLDYAEIVDSKCYTSVSSHDEISNTGSGHSLACQTTAQ